LRYEKLKLNLAELDVNASDCPEPLLCFESRNEFISSEPGTLSQSATLLQDSDVGSELLDITEKLESYKNKIATANEQDAFIEKVVDECYASWDDRKEKDEILDIDMKICKNVNEEIAAAVNVIEIIMCKIFSTGKVVNLIGKAVE
jgi:hypothetical protein